MSFFLDDRYGLKIFRNIFIFEIFPRVFWIVSFWNDFVIEDLLPDYPKKLRMIFLLAGLSRNGISF